ncbi:MAG: hypothetical protein IJ776_00590 [Paludibacteraceae bacterium]|nr:hypothetical protein [Paludibacteraceae bacterium]
MVGSAQNIVNERIKSVDRGNFFFGQDFGDVANPATIRKILERLVKEGILMRISMGIYYYPKIDTQYGLGAVYPSMSDIAEAIARRDQVTIVPTGSYALNMLGLSTQVPGNAVFLTTGSSRQVPIGEGKGIKFIHTSSAKKMAFQSHLMMLIVSAMREIGENNLTEEQMEIIKHHLANVKQDEFQHDIQLAPVWVRQTLHKL